LFEKLKRSRAQLREPYNAERRNRKTEKLEHPKVYGDCGRTSARAERAGKQNPYKRRNSTESSAIKQKTGQSCGAAKRKHN
jgi:hypothetical protein